MPTAYKQPMPMGRPAVAPRARPMALTREQLELMDRRNELLRIAGGEGTVNSFLYRQRAARIEDQLLAAPAGRAAAPARKPMAKQPAAPAARPAPTPSELAPTPLQFDPLAGAQPVPTQATAPAPEAAAPVSPAEDAAAAAKAAEEDRLRKLEEARAAEMKRREDVRRRRGTGVMSFLTGSFRGLPGLPTGLSSVLGV